MRRARIGALAAIAISAAPLHAIASEPAAPGAIARAPALQDAVARGPSLDERIAEIQRRIQAALVYPALARQRRIEGTALLGFETGADGSARRIAVARSSGFRALDRAALRAVHDAHPLPYVYGRLEVPVLFELTERAPEPAATP